MHLVVNGKGRVRPLLAVSLLALMMTAAACEGPAGPTGPAGSIGGIGGAGPTGPTGPAGTPGASVAGRTIFGLDGANGLISFGAFTPDRIIAKVTVTGLAAGETLIGIDFRPANDTLYAVSSASRVYTVNVTTGIATAVGSSAFTPALSGTSFGIGFNPVADRLRIHSTTGQNLRVNQLTGAVAANDTALAYVAGDANFGASPNIVATAYTNSVRPTPLATDLYAIDSNRDILVEVDRPNGGTLRTIGSLNFNTSEDAGFDIAGDTDIAYASLTPSSAPGGPSRLYQINLRTGNATLLGAINNASPLRSIAVAP